MRARNDLFRFRAVEMRAPIWHHAVTAVWAVSFAAIANDGVIRNSHFRCINHRERRIGWLKAPDAVRHTFGTSGQLHKLGAGERGRHSIKQLEWKPDEANPKAAYPAAGHVTSPMRSTNEHNAFDSRICVISQSSHNETVTRVVGENTFGE